MSDRDADGSDAATSLALAIVAASEAPLLLLDDSSNIVAASLSFARIFDIDRSVAVGRPLFEPGSGEWDVPQLRSLLDATRSGLPKVGAYEMDLARAERPTRRLVLSAESLSYADAANARLLLTVVDVTEARLAERVRSKILEEKTILLQELQHRVANSLQIIAGVLMQSARRVQSEETRSHLFEAHNRVMSVAAIQRHLAASRVNDIEMRAYLTELCESIGTSMISDAHDLTLEVAIDDSVTTADFSTSIGLVVTELVINALKHAFPGQQAGRIDVSYSGHGGNWTLAVADDGVGMPEDPLLQVAGLGTSIVGAIAHRLSARVERIDTRPGTKVSMVRVDDGSTRPSFEDAI